MKKYNTLFVVAITILVVTLLTWILPVTYLSGELVEAERAQIGIANLLNYPVFTFYNFIYIFVYILAIGGLYGLLNKTGAYRLILDWVCDHVKERKVITLVITVLLIALLVSFTGLTFEVLIILPFIAGVILLLGYNRIVAMMVTVGSVSVGVIGTTFSKTVAGAFNEMLSTSYTDLIWVKVGLLVLCSAVLILNIVFYAKKEEKDEKEEIDSFLVPEKVKGGILSFGKEKVKAWPLVTLFIAFIVIVIVSVTNWSDAFGITFFSDLLDKINGSLVLSKYVVLTVSLFVVLYNILRGLYKKKKEKEKKLLSKKGLIVTIIFSVVGTLALAKILLEDAFKTTDFLSKALELIKVNGLIEAFTWQKLLGTFEPFGNWTYNDITILIIILGLCVKFIYHVKFAEVVESVGDGFKKILYTAIVCILSYTVLIQISSHPIILTMLKPILELTDGLSILWYPIATFVSALCNTDFTYYKYGALTLSYATTFFTSSNIYPLCGLITQSMYGLALLVAPTSVILLGSLSLLNVKYLTWLKKMWKPILEIVLLIFVSYILVLQFMV